jgi:ribonuclease/clavin/mitogillin
MSRCQILSSCWASPEGEIYVLPLRTPTLAPATHTNTSFVGTECFWIVDPATPHAEEREKLLHMIADLDQQGRRPLGIVLTHHHRDHVGGAIWLREQLQIPIFSHPITKELLSGTLCVDLELVEGDILRGSKKTSDVWQVLHTPGHASGHIVLWNAELRLLVGGDMVAAVGTILVEPPDGHMATYIRELIRLRALKPTRIVPAHGDVILQAVDHLTHYIEHRLKREAKVFQNLGSEDQGLAAITSASYADVPQSLHRLAEGSTLAHLIKLEEEGRATRSEEGLWRRTASED